MVGIFYIYKYLLLYYFNLGYYFIKLIKIYLPNKTYLLQN